MIPKELNAILMQPIEDAMKQKKISRAELARMVGKNRSAITKYFNCTEFINVKTLAKIMTALDIKISFVVT